MSNTKLTTPLLRKNLPALHLAQTPKSAYLLAKLLAGALFVMPFIMIGVPWQQNIPGKGRVIGTLPTERQQSVKAPVKGRIMRWWVAEGSIVKKGDKLLEMSDNDPNYLDRLNQKEEATKIKLSAALGKLKAYTDQVTAIEESQALALEAANQSVRMAQDKVDSAQREVEAAKAENETAELNLARQKQLLKDGLTSRRKFELTVLKTKQSLAKWQSNTAKLAAEKKYKKALESKRDQVLTDYKAKINSSLAKRDNSSSEVASARSALLEIETSLARQRLQLVTAPCDGTILRLATFGAGEIIKAGETLLIIVPETDNLGVELWVDGNDMPLITKGRHVRLQFEGWPAVQFAGWPSVAVGTFGGTVRLVDATDDGTGKFRIVVVPDKQDQEWPSQPFLRQGVRAKGWILLNQVTIGYELWRQLNGFPPAVNRPKPKKSKVKTKK